MDEPFPSSLAAFAAAVASADKRGLPEAQVMRLREVLDLYRAPCPFVAGDLVTPRQGSSIADAGLPHIVLEVVPRMAPVMVAVSETSSLQGARFDMRVAAITRTGSVGPWWQESYRYERWPLSADGEA